MTVQLPTQKHFSDWFVDLIRSRPDLTIAVPPAHTDDWRKWAMLLIANNRTKLSKVVLPLKEKFPESDSWRQWAYFFIQYS